MKKMIYKYSTKPKIEILDTGFCKGYLYYILNLGTHPTAYIRIPKGHKYYQKDIYEISLNVHGGITYSNKELCVCYPDKEVLNGWFIGWDYGHYGDYSAIEELYPMGCRTGGKKWTTEEIREEVIEACKELEEMEVK